ncbi:MAG TPA: carboxymuconolactone decarboxylase family protein [Abditibacteriaceae bacterium]|jgi:uncharacterized peroxidase-related enzyme
MAYIAVPEGIPGIRGLLAAFPETGEPLRSLTQALLCGPSSLTRGERELIGAYVSTRNGCTSCARSHAAIARHLLEEQRSIVADVMDGNCDTLDARMQALLAIAEKVRRDGREVTLEDVAGAREAGADDKAIHDTVLITGLFCLFNRYVDGLGTRTLDDEQLYEASGAYRAVHGYQTITNQ